MADFSKTTLRLITDLLHDAKVQEVTWDRNLATFTIQFDCLRRKVDGSELTDRTIEFKLMGVQAVGVGYDSPLETGIELGARAGAESGATCCQRIAPFGATSNTLLSILTS
jgi:hypothetical protein